MRHLAAIHVSLALAAAAAGDIPKFASAFAPPRPSVGTASKYAPKSQSGSSLGVGGPGGASGNNADAAAAGSGVYYDADPTRMNLAAAAAAENMLALQQNTPRQQQQQQPPQNDPTTQGAPETDTAPMPTPVTPAKRTTALPKDVLIIGSGLAGLSAALHMATTTTRHVTILEREDPLQQMTKTTAGSFAAAGMLAPQSERLPTGPLLDLCLASRQMYADFVDGVEDWAKNCGREGEQYLWRDVTNAGTGEEEEKSKGNNMGGSSNQSLQPWEVGFTAAGGFLAPAFAGDSVATWAPPSQSGAVRWLDAVQVRELEPQLHRDVVGGWWFPEDASVDARRLTCSLRAACVGAGVQFMVGSDCEATSLELSGGTCRGVRLADGRNLAPKSILVANGSWMRNLLPVPIVPHKGQSFSVRMPADSPPILSRVLFAQDTYIVPKVDGRIVVGATVEAGSFDPNVTPAGLMHCISNAAQLVPALADLPIEETWAGLRPTTPDKGPILGKTPWDNLFLAGGYWRNGVLLAPKTGQLVGDLIAGNLSEEDEALMGAFSWDRFTAEGGGDKLAADARYAASMHPVHRRSSGAGVSAAVGTELGFYSGAGEAKEERARDRQSLFSDGGISESQEDAFEKAAMMGKVDAGAFTLGDDVEKAKLSTKAVIAEPVPDAYTVGSSEEDSKPIVDALFSQYRTQIDEVKEEATSSGDGLASKEEIEAQLAGLDESSVGTGSDYDETTYDGYQAILKDDWGSTDADLKEKMRKSRIQNRKKSGAINEDAIGVKPMDPKEIGTQPKPSKTNDISSVYEKIKANKAKASESVEMTEATADDRPDPGFRLFRVDSTTGEGREVPPYTSPGAMEEMIALEKNGVEIEEEEEVEEEAKVEIKEPKAEVPSSFDAATSDEYTEETYDGYQAILKDDWGSTDEELKEKMRKSRIQNRMKSSSIDENAIGVKRLDVEDIKSTEAQTKPPKSVTTETVLKLEQPDLSAVYDKIISNKKKTTVEMTESAADNRPDPGFRIYRVDPVTGEGTEVPPYTSPGAMEDMIAAETLETREAN